MCKDKCTQYLILNILCGHQIQEKLRALQEERQKLTDNWQSKQKWLENTYLEQVFYRDTEYMEKIANSQEVSALVKRNRHYIYFDIMHHLTRVWF